MLAGSLGIWFLGLSMSRRSGGSLSGGRSATCLNLGSEVSMSAETPVGAGRAGAASGAGLAALGARMIFEVSGWDCGADA